MASIHGKSVCCKLFSHNSAPENTIDLLFDDGEMTAVKSQGHFLSQGSLGEAPIAPFHNRLSTWKGGQSPGMVPTHMGTKDGSGQDFLEIAHATPVGNQKPGTRKERHQNSRQWEAGSGMTLLKKAHKPLYG